MTRVKRFDRATITKAIKLDTGWLKAPATLTRTGIRPYRADDGSVRRELRLPDEVFKAGSLATLSMVPVTKAHPPGLLDATNAQEYSVGSVGTDVRQDGDFVVATLMITDAEAVRAVESGSHREISCGYTCDLDFTPGEWEGQRYDAIQKSILYNHVALESVGRAGPGVKVHLDKGAGEQSDDAGTNPNTQPQEIKIMSTIKLDGVDHECSAQLAQAINVRQAKTDAEASEAEAVAGEQMTELDKLKAENEALKAKVAELEATAKDAADPEKQAEAVQARVALEKDGEKVLGDEPKMDTMTDQAIKLAVIAKVSPEAKMDGKSDEYVGARFDAAMEGWTPPASNPPAGNPGLAGARQAAQTGAGTRLDAAAARQKRMDEDDQRWQKPLN